MEGPIDGTSSSKKLSLSGFVPKCAQWCAQVEMQIAVTEVAKGDRAGAGVELLKQP